MKNPLHILMIDDSEEDTDLVMLEFHRNAFTPEYLRVDTREALVQALQSQRWDIILSDYSMPSFDGLSALKIVQASGFDIPFILISGTIGEELAVKAMKAGVQDYIMKGNLQRLIPVINRELHEAEIRFRQKQAEKDFLDSEEKFKNVFNNSVLGLAVTSTKGYLKTNKAFADILGYEQEELSTLNWRDITHPDDVAYNDKIVKDILAGEKVNERWEKRYYHKNGNIVWVEISTTLMRNQKGEALYFITTINDITKRKHDEQEIQQQVKELQQWYDISVNREEQMIELKKEVNALLKSAGKSEKYETE